MYNLPYQVPYQIPGTGINEIAGLTNVDMRNPGNGPPGSNNGSGGSAKRTVLSRVQRSLEDGFIRLQQRAADEASEPPGQHMAFSQPGE